MQPNSLLKQPLYFDSVASALQVTNALLGEASIWFCKKSGVKMLHAYIRESVDTLCRDGADVQYMQYLSKSRITSPQTR